MKKILAISSTLIGVVFLAGCGQQQASQTQPTTPVPVAQTPATNQPVATQPAPTQSSQTNQSTQNVYTNSDYGFQVTVPSDFGAYKTMTEKDYGGSGVTYIHFIFSTKDKASVEENFVTHEKFPGYMSLFAFTVYTKDAYAKATVECKKNPTPECPDDKLGENNKYIFTVRPAGGSAPDDLANVQEKIVTEDLGKLLNFKVIN